MNAHSLLVIKITTVFLLLFSSALYPDTAYENKPSQQLETVNLQLKWFHQFQFAGYYAAIEKGFYEDEGLDVQVHELAKNTSVVSQVVSGQAQYGVGDSAILIDYAEGQPIKAISAIFQHNSLVFISKQSSGIFSPYDMAGKRIMLSGSSRDSAPLLATLLQAGVLKSDYTYVDNTYRNDDLIEDKIDVMIGYRSNEPFYFAEQDVGINIISPRNYGIDFYGDLLFTSQQEISEHPYRADRFRRASLKGWQYALSNPEEIIQLIHKKYGSQSSIQHLRNEAKITRDLILLDSIPVGTIKTERLQQTARTYARLKLSKPLSKQEIESFIHKGSTPQIELSEKEQQWLQEHPSIRIGIDRSFAPYEWIDEEGHYIGLAADYIDLLEKQIGFDIEIVQEDAWHKVLSLAKQGEIDMLSIVVKTDERNEFLNFSEPYVTSAAVIINRESQGFIGDLAKLEGKQVAIQKGHFTQELLSKYYPKISIITTDNQKQALTLVSEGEADAYVGEVLTASLTMKKAGLVNLRFAGQTEYTSKFSFAISKEAPELSSMVNKALAGISQKEKSHIYDHWRSQEIQLGIQTHIIVKYLAVIVCVFLIIIYWLYRLNSEVALRKEAEKSLKLSSRVFSDTLEGITITDANKNIVDVNPAFSDITGYSREEVLGKNPKLLNSGRQVPEFYTDMWLKINEQGYWQGEIWNRKKSGEVYAELLTISSLTDTNGNIVNYVGVFSDITSSKQQQEQLQRMAHFDVLTGLPNRALFSDRFHQAIAHSKRSESLLAVCFLDLDNFKPVNDNFGHDVGDELLIEVANRIKSCIREEDTVSRQGGDEFTLLLNNIVSFAQCEHTMERIHHSLAQPFIFHGQSHNITASSGITLYPLDDGDADTLLRHADQAMYEAKQTGRNRYHLFNAEEDQETAHKHHRLSEIEQALVNGDLCLYYQPKVNMVTGEVFGAEALIRWIHPEKGVIPPLEFLPLIDGTDLEIRIGDWVINEAITQLDLWQQPGIDLEVSINVSSHHLLSAGFYNHLESTLEKYPSVDSKSLQIEILESSVLGDLEAISHIIKSCKEGLGIHFALDDFGTGYSSLAHLKNLPADTIKIDQTFIRDILEDPDDYAIIDGVIGLADSFSRKVIAEGVETTEHGLLLLTMGCEEAQGYGVARPMPASEIPHWLVEYTANKDWLISGNKDRSTKENKLELFRLTSEQWQNNFVSNIQALPETIERWPLMDNKHCHCGQWIKRAKQEQLFNQECLNSLNKAHKKVHILAHALYLHHQEGKLDTARGGLPELQVAFDEMALALKQCK